MSRFLKFGFIAVLAFFASQSIYGDNTDNTQRVSEISKDLTTVAITCPQKIWLQENLKKIQILIVDQVQQEAWLWNDLQTKKELSSIQYQSLPSEFKFGMYGFSTFDGIDAMSIALNETKDEIPDPSGDEAFVTIAHEAFHRYFQNAWTIKNQLVIGLRGDLYPAPWEPRYFRRQILGPLLFG